MLARTLRLLCLAGTLGCLGADSAGPEIPAREGRPILFIGNSLTYVNDLPLIVEALADSVPGLTPAQRLAPAMAAFPDYALEDHWANGTAVRAIDQGKWSVVGTAAGLIGARRKPREPPSVDEAVRRANSSRRRPDGDVRRLAIRESPVRLRSRQRVVYPRGDGCERDAVPGWRGVARRVAPRSQPRALCPDGLHPSVRGSYIGALVITSMLLDKSPVGMPAGLTLRSGATLTIPTTDAAVLQEAAATAIAKFESVRRRQ
jgi:hypothetical protein